MLNQQAIQREIIKRKAQQDFYYFVKYIFSKSFDNFVLGDFIKQTCSNYQNNTSIIRVSARNHFKTIGNHAYIMWHLFKERDTDMECHYFSYRSEMAQYFVSANANANNLKALIERNPWFADLIDMNPKSQSAIDYSWNGKNRFTLLPQGLLTAKRGLHIDKGLLIVDDPLQDPDNKLSPTSIRKVNDIFFTQILDIPNTRDVPFVVVGTPQTDIDFFFSNEVTHQFKVFVQPAVKNPKYDSAGWLIDGDPLWKEWRSLDDLKHRQRTRGQKAFKQEYMCTPIYDNESFLDRAQLLSCVNDNLLLKPQLDTENDVIAGFDIGKKLHPSHLVVYEVVGNKLIERYEKWLDGWNYVDQIELLNEVIDDMGIDYLYYDNTRGEFESLYEQGELGSEFVPVSIGRKTYNDLGRELDKKVSQREIEIANNNRTISQMLAMNNDFKAVDSSSTGGGHGESFVSTLLCMKYFTEAQLDIYVP